MHILSFHTPVIFVSTAPEGIFVKLWYSFGDIFWNSGYQNPRTHSSSNKCKQAESLLSSCSHATFQSTKAPHQVCYILNYVPCVFRRWRFSFAARTWHFQLMCFKSTYFWGCRSGRALLAPAAPALHSDAWRVRCWRSLGLVSIYNSSWWVAVGTHLPVS